MRIIQRWLILMLRRAVVVFGVALVLMVGLVLVSVAVGEISSGDLLDALLWMVKSAATIGLVFFIPYVCAMALAAIVFPEIVPYFGIEPWRCRRCLYDLRNLEADRCPECGRAVHAGPTVKT